MKILRADFIENYVNADEMDAGYILLDEFTKSLMLFPRAANDILGVKDKAPMELAEIASSGVNPKQAERLVKLMLLVNRRTDEQDFADVTEMERDSLRSLLSKNGAYFDENKEDIATLAGDLQSVLTDPNFLVEANQMATDYANFGGEDEKKSRKWLYIGGAIAVLGLTAFLILRKR